MFSTLLQASDFYKSTWKGFDVINMLRKASWSNLILKSILLQLKWISCEDIGTGLILAETGGVFQQKVTF